MSRRECYVRKKSYMEKKEMERLREEVTADKKERKILLGYAVVRKKQ
jgi:hypothetical protein